MITDIVLIIAGIALLTAGAEILVRGSSGIGKAAGMSPLITGLTIVAFATSSPELAVSMRAAMSASEGADIAIGNVVGSNIFNILFILGISASITPVFISSQLVRRELPLMIIVSVLVLVLGADGRILRAEGITLVVCMTLYIAFSIYRTEKGHLPAGNAAESMSGGKDAFRQMLLNIAQIAVGIVMLVAGSGILVDSAVKIAAVLQISDLVIGLTVLAAGTSLPEVATSVTAILKGKRDIAVGNVIGSNIFNILIVLGLSAAAGPYGVSVPQSALYFDIPVMIAASVVCLPIFFTGLKISRWEGGLFIGYYFAYTLFLILKAQQNDMLALFSSIMIYAVIPLTVITLVITVMNSRRKKVMNSENQ